MAEEKRSFDIKKLFSNYAIYFALVIIIVAIVVKNPRFLSIGVWKDILTQSSTRLILALGVSFVHLSGGADLSMGRSVGMAAVISASMLQTADYARRFFETKFIDVPFLLPILIAILVCAAFGMLGGFSVAYLKVPPFIATLGTQVIIYGICSIYYDMEPNNSQPIAGLRREFSLLGTGAIGPIPTLIVFAVLALLVVWVIQSKTVFGKNLYALGGNAEAARVSGIHVERMLLAVYTICGAMAGIAGALEAARSGGATNNYGLSYELDAMASCVVGGVSQSGGVGNVAGVFVGVMIFNVISYGLTFIGLNPNWQQIFKGVIILAATALDARKYASRS